MTRRILTAREQLQMLSPWREAAMNQDLVNSLRDQFHDWYHQHKDIHRLESGGKYGPLRSWKNVEKFLKHNYPAAHRGYSLGAEQAGQVMDYPLDGDRKYLSGPKAVQRYGYDPKEIAASMLLLHNRSHPFRMKEVGEDRDRLDRIVQRRQRLQDVYDRRQDIQGDMPQSDVDTLAELADKRTRMASTVIVTAALSEDEG